MPQNIWKGENGVRMILFQFKGRSFAEFTDTKGRIFTKEVAIAGEPALESSEGEGPSLE